MRRLGWLAPVVCLLTVCAGVAPAGATTPPGCAGGIVTVRFAPPLQPHASGAPETVTVRFSAVHCDAHGNPTTITSAKGTLQLPGGRLDSCGPLLSAKPWQQKSATTGSVRYQPADTPGSSLGAGRLEHRENGSDQAVLRIAGEVTKGSFAGDDYGLNLLVSEQNTALRHTCAHGGIAAVHSDSVEFTIG
jgi:hypothetical protein